MTRLQWALAVAALSFVTAHVCGTKAEKCSSLSSNVKFCFEAKQSCYQRCGLPGLDQDYSLLSLMTAECSCDEKCLVYNDCCWDMWVVCPEIFNKARLFQNQSMNFSTVCPSPFYHAIASPDCRPTNDATEATATSESTISSVLSTTEETSDLPRSTPHTRERVESATCVSDEESVRGPSTCSRCSMLMMIRRSFNHGLDPINGVIHGDVDELTKCKSSIDPSLQTITGNLLPVPMEFQLNLMSEWVSLEKSLLLETTVPLVRGMAPRRCETTPRMWCPRCVSVPLDSCESNIERFNLIENKTMYSESYRQGQYNSTLIADWNVSQGCITHLEGMNRLLLLFTMHQDLNGTASIFIVPPPLDSKGVYRVMSLNFPWQVRRCPCLDMTLDQCPVEQCSRNAVPLEDGHCYKPVAIGFFQTPTGKKFFGQMHVDTLNNPNDIIRFVGVTFVPALRSAKSCTCVYLQQMYRLAFSEIVSHTNISESFETSFMSCELGLSKEKMSLAVEFTMNCSTGDLSPEKLEQCEHVQEEIREILSDGRNEAVRPTPRSDWYEEIGRPLHFLDKTKLDDDPRRTKLAVMDSIMNSSSDFSPMPSVLNEVIHRTGQIAQNNDLYCEETPAEVYTCLLFHRDQQKVDRHVLSALIQRLFSAGDTLASFIPDNLKDIAVRCYRAPRNGDFIFRDGGQEPVGPNPAEDTLFGDGTLPTMPSNLFLPSESHRAEIANVKVLQRFGKEPPVFDEQPPVEDDDRGLSSIVSTEASKSGGSPESEIPRWSLFFNTIVLSTACLLRGE